MWYITNILNIENAILRIVYNFFSSSLQFIYFHFFLFHSTQKRDVSWMFVRLKEEYMEEEKHKFYKMCDYKSGLHDWWCLMTCQNIYGRSYVCGFLQQWFLRVKFIIGIDLNEDFLWLFEFIMWTKSYLLCLISQWTMLEVFKWKKISDLLHNSWKNALILFGRLVI